MKHFKHMKRIKAFILALCLFISNCPYSFAASKYTLPEQLRVVPARADGLSFPEELPPFVPILDFSMDNGLVHLELGDTVPKLIILEQRMREGADPVESTIFSKKNASTADAHLIGKETPQVIVRMIWPFGETDYVREYASGFGNLAFTGCTVVEEPQPADFEPYTLSERTLTFNEAGNLVSETRKFSNEKRRLTRTVNYDSNGDLQTVNLNWESVKPGEYQLTVELDREGCITGLFYKEDRTRFYVKSMRIDEDPNATMLLARDSLDFAVFDEKVNKKYPQLALGLLDDVSLSTDPEPATMTDLQAVTIADLQPATMTDLQTVTMEDLQTATMAEPQAVTLADFQAVTMEDLQAATMAELQAVTLTGSQTVTMAERQAATMESFQPARMEELQTVTMKDLQPATMTDLQPEAEEETPEEKYKPIPTNARIWSINLGTRKKNEVYAFISTEPVLVIREGKVILDQDVKDVNDEKVKLGKKRHIVTPVVELITIDDQKAE